MRHFPPARRDLAATSWAGKMVIDDGRQANWRIHCLQMAKATHALADACEDPQMIGAYVALAARWINMSAEPPAWPDGEPRLN